MNVIDAVVDRDSHAGLETTSGQSVGRPADFFERVSCYLCGATETRPFVTAQDDLGGTPGEFQFVRCSRCDLAYQNPRVSLDTSLGTTTTPTSRIARSAIGDC